MMIGAVRGVRGFWSTWTSAAGKTYAVDWDNIFKRFGNNVTSDPNWIIKAMDAGFAYGGPRVQVDTVAPFNPATTPVPQQPSEQVTTVVGPTRIVYGQPITYNIPPGQSSGPSQIQTQNIQPLQPVNNQPVIIQFPTQTQAPAQQGTPLIRADLTTLPKINTHTQLGGLGDPSGCSIFDPTSYGTCATWIIQARTELADAHNQILDLANSWASAIQEIQFWPESDAKQAALTDAQTQLQAATQLVQAHTQVQNEFESKIQPYVNIGLTGLWKSGPSVGRLGLLPAWLILTATTLIISGLLAWGVTSAMALRANYNAQAAYFNTFTNYYQTCRDLAAQGKPCNLQGPPSQGPGSDWGSSTVTWAILIGLGALVIVNLTKR